MNGFCTWPCLEHCPHKYSKDAARQGQTESIYRRLMSAAVLSMHDLRAQPEQSAQIKCVLVFTEGEKTEYLEKNPRSRVENQHQLTSV